MFLILGSGFQCTTKDNSKKGRMGIMRCVYRWPFFSVTGYQLPVTGFI